MTQFETLFRLLLGAYHTNISIDALLLLLLIVLYVLKCVYTHDGTQWQLPEPRSTNCHTLRSGHFLCFGFCGELEAYYTISRFPTS